MNIFVRQNDNDLLKYLCTTELEIVRKIEKIDIFENEEILLRAGDKAEELFVVVNGNTKTRIPGDSEGNPLEIGRNYEGEIIGELLFCKDTVSPFEVVVSPNTTICRYSFRDLFMIMERDYQISSKILAAINDSLSEKVIKLTQKLA